jgi:hypothetical protein
MTERAIDFNAEYSVSLIDRATRAFVHRLFRKYLWLLVFACIMNIVGFVAVLVLPGANTWMIVGIGAIAILGPVFFAWQYLRLPGELSARMKEVLVPNAEVSITPSTFTLAAKGRSFTSRWTDLKAITEYQDYFLFVVGLLAFTFIPKNNMPTDAQQLIRAAAANSVPPNPSMQPAGQERPAAD